MEITDHLVDKLATLSRLSFSGEKKQAIKGDLQKMIGFVEKLQELNTSGIEPLRHMSEAEDVLRPDVKAEPMDSKDALMPASVHNGSFFTVPKVIG